MIKGFWIPWKEEGKRSSNAFEGWELLFFDKTLNQYQQK